MAITGVGTVAYVSGVGTTLGVAPTALGDCLVLATSVYDTVSGTSTVSTVSGGGCTTWTRVGGPFKGFVNNQFNIEFWLGTVTTTGSSTITVTLTGNSDQTRLLSQQFTAGLGASTAWAKDGTQVANSNNTAASTTVTFPTLTPGGAGRLYVGFSAVASGASTSTGTSGYTCQAPSGYDSYIYNGNVSTVQSPTVTASSAVTSFSEGVLMTATLPVAADQGGFFF